MRSWAARAGALLSALAIVFTAQPALADATPGQAGGEQVAGTIAAMSGSWFTIQVAGRRTGVVNAMVDTASALTEHDYPYAWGGGHFEAGVASAAAATKGHRRSSAGFDCSGSVAAVLAGAGLWPPGAPVPSDAGVIAQLLHQKLIARGPGKGPVEVTLYDHPGVHIFMNIDGRFFGTSDGGGGGSAKGGPGWLYDGARDAFSAAFKQYHVLPSVLKGITTYGQALTFRTDEGAGLLQAAALGDRVVVTYAPGGSATMVASALDYVGALTATGTVASVAEGGFSIQAADGSSIAFSTGASGLTEGLAAGDVVEVTYTASGSDLLARRITVTAGPPAAPEGSDPPGAWYSGAEGADGRQGPREAPRR
ncbi:MAG TPA: hypothetical protein VFW29_05965 [Solirubrobacteraceae bacterium]|nr:hypothetical protein [Solirubrobacteraceae bacterium]